MNMKKKINMCLFISIIFLLIQIKFDDDTNNDELLETREGKNTKKGQKKSCPPLALHSNAEPKLL
jgi:hypothetical protein